MQNDCTFQFSIGGMFAEIALQVVTSSTPTLTDIDHLKADIWDNFKPHTSTGTSLTTITLGSGLTFLSKSYTSESGSHIGVDSTANQAYHIRKVVAAGRPGSFFWPGVYAGAYNANGQASSSLNSAMAAICTSMYSGLTGHGLDIAVPQKGGGVQIATGYALRPTVGNQRRRLH